MRRHLLILTGAALASVTVQAQQAPRVVEHGSYVVHLILREIGTEEYDITDSGTHRQLAVTTNTSDRGMKRTTTTALDYQPDLTPTRFEQHSITPATATA